MQKLYIIQHAHNIHGNVTHKFRRPIGTRFHNGPAVKVGFAKAQNTSVLSKKIDKGDHPAQKLAERGGNRRPGQLVFLWQQNY
ncbi:hypothetical protein SDC9_95130 [bioreactor metagenome]|uniref:Uncharacterized protein n=1 Tax=bioreactor metagenome TaxID=1076179 RepID=A0A645A5E3_9ZZZZ